MQFLSREGLPNLISLLSLHRSMLPLQRVALRLVETLATTTNHGMYKKMTCELV
jgi:hypothetical protein